MPASYPVRVIRLKFLSFVVLAASCSSGSAVMNGTGPLAEKRHLHEFTKLSARELSCPASSVAYEFLEGRFHRGTGCGKSVEFAVYCNKGRDCLWFNLEVVRHRAAYELRCDAPLKVTEVAPVTFGLDGCGRRAVYAWHSTAGWMLTSVSAEPGSSAENSP